jgi:ABC-type transport system involved in multi-copper enzyme maturation permease subunit
MIRARSLSPLLIKETRALLPVWAGTMAALGAAFALHGRSYSDLAVIGYVGGAVSLGAHSIGHEYGGRTLPMLLAQPAARWRLFAAKMLIVGAMLALLAAAAALVFSADRFRGNDGVATIVLPILASLFTTPLLTMLCRNTLAGAILGVSGPMTLWVLTMVVAWWAFGVDGNTVSVWFLRRWVLIATIACPILAALTWRVFSRLEAVEGTPLTLTLPRWAAARAGVRRPAPWRALFAKEVHLQQMTIAITVFYGVIWTMGVGLRDTVPASVALPLEAVLLLYCMGLAVVIGALASAEERQLGTLEVQLLQPVSALAQWVVKCVVALSLAVLLGVALPVGLITVVSLNTGSIPIVAMSPTLFLLVIMLTSSSLYISSLVGSGVKAMTWSLPAGIGVAIFIQTTRTAIASASTRLGNPVPADTAEASLVAAHVLTLLIVPVLLWFGFVNHTTAEHRWPRTLAQLATTALLMAVGVFAAGALIP